jgi:hypothetical protein
VPEADEMFDIHVAMEAALDASVVAGMRLAALP